MKFLSETIATPYPLIINVCENRKTFSNFVKEISKETLLGCSFACIHHDDITPSCKIGQRTTRRQIAKDREGKNKNKCGSIAESKNKDQLVCEELNIKVIGFSVSWCTNKVNYLSFMPESGKYKFSGYDVGLRYIRIILKSAIEFKSVIY